MTYRTDLPHSIQRDFSDELADLATHGCEITFDVEQECYPRDPFSHGLSREWGHEVAVWVYQIRICDLRLNRDQAIEAFGAERIKAIEAAELDRLQCEHPSASFGGTP